MPKLLRALVVAALPTVVANSAWAQLPQPKLQSLSRPGVQAGETADVTVRGTDLEGVNALWFDHPGLRAFHLKGPTFRVVCATGTTVGTHDVRVVGPYGVSNPRAFVVGDRPESVEVEPNNTAELAKPIALNSVVNGEVAATDIDCFAIEGKQGQRIFIDVAGERIDSRIDATLRVLDPSGKEIAENRDTNGADPFLDLSLPADGRYVIKLHDVTYAGSPDHVYRMTVHDGPVLDAIVPTVAALGSNCTFTLVGRNLGGTPAPDLVAVDARPLERKEVSITLPAGGPDATHPTLGYVTSPSAVREGFEYALTTERGTSNRVFIAEATDPVIIEHEPNDEEPQAQVVTLPCDVSGSFGRPGDTDIYRFTAKKGEVWWIEADAERLGSPGDPVFIVQKVVEKGPAQDLGTGEDQPDPALGPRFTQATVDASLRWQAPDDGTYQVVVTDLYSSQRGEPRMTYRLNIRPERPDFGLVLVPNSPNQVDSVVLRAGGQTAAYVLAKRLNGFAGAIQVSPRDLPPGVSCEPVVIGPGQVLVPLVFKAAEDAKDWVGAVTLVGRTRIGDRKDELSYTRGASLLGPDAEHTALGGGLVWPPGNPQAPTVALARVTRGFVLAVLGEPAPFTVSAQPAHWTVAQGHQLTLDVNIARRTGFTEAVALTETELPPNLPVVAATVAKEAKSASVPLFVPKNVAPGNYTFVLRGTGAFPFSKDPNAKTKPNVNLVEPSNPITITVRPAPVNLAVNNKGGALKAGAQLEVDVTVNRQNGFTGDVQLHLAAPETLKLSADPSTVVAPQTAGKLSVRAAADSPAGAAAAIAVRAVCVVNGEPIEVDEVLALTISK